MKAAQPLTTGVQVEEQAMEAAPAEHTLRVADRCDHRACRAQAFVITVHAGLPLMHCGHHYQAHEEALFAFVAVDNRGSINTAASLAAF